MMAPVFSNLSVKYSAAVFLTVDVEKCQVSYKWSVIHCLIIFFAECKEKQIMKKVCLYNLCTGLLVTHAETLYMVYLCCGSIDRGSDSKVTMCVVQICTGD